VVCLPCFIQLGDEKLVAWDQQIEFFPVSLAKHLKGLDEMKKIELHAYQRAMAAHLVNSRDEPGYSTFGF